MSLKVGLIGRGIQASRSPAMHEAEAARLGLALQYDLFDTESDARSLAEILESAQTAGYAGLNITYPFKQAVLELLDDISPSAQRVGAVNTVVFEGRKRIGHNTDCAGFAHGFREGLPDAQRARVLLVGAGGAGVAVGVALQDLGVQDVLVHDRNRALAETLVDRLGGAAQLLPDLSNLPDLDGVVNATPMGMVSHPGSAVPVQALSPRLWVADIVYFPLETRLLQNARALGCRTLSGAGMAVHQAALAFELFTGQQADPAHLRAQFEAFSR